MLSARNFKYFCTCDNSNFFRVGSILASMIIIQAKFNFITTHLNVSSLIFTPNCKKYGEALQTRIHACPRTLNYTIIPNN